MGWDMRVGARSQAEHVAFGLIHNIKLQSDRDRADPVSLYAIRKWKIVVITCRSRERSGWVSWRTKLRHDVASRHQFKWERRRSRNLRAEEPKLLLSKTELVCPAHED